MRAIAKVQAALWRRWPLLPPHRYPVAGQVVQSIVTDHLDHSLDFTRGLLHLI